MIFFNCLGENIDFQIDNATGLVISPEESQACLQFRTIDDLIAENAEEVTITFEMGSQPVGNTTVVITDDDGMYVCGGEGGGGGRYVSHELVCMNNPFDFISPLKFKQI